MRFFDVTVNFALGKFTYQNPSILFCDVLYYWRLFYVLANANIFVYNNASEQNWIDGYAHNELLTFLRPSVQNIQWLWVQVQDGEILLRFIWGKFSEGIQAYRSNLSKTYVNALFFQNKKQHFLT